jgi:hypothetical protein
MKLPKTVLKKYFIALYVIIKPYLASPFHPGRPILSLSVTNRQSTAKDLPGLAQSATGPKRAAKNRYLPAKGRKAQTGPTTELPGEYL